MENNKFYDYVQLLNVTDNDIDFDFCSYYNLSKSAIEVFTNDDLEAVQDNDNFIRLPQKVCNSDIFPAFFGKVSDPDDLSTLEDASRRKGFFRKLGELGYSVLWSDTEFALNADILLNWCKVNNISF